MFDVYCPSHAGRVLLGPSSITGFTNTDRGVVMQWRCHCGGTGTEHFGGHVEGVQSTPVPAQRPAA